MTGCTEGAGPDGQRVVLVVTRRGDYQEREVRVGIPGDLLLSISVANVGATGATDESPPLSMAQLRAIATEVAGQIRA